MVDSHVILARIDKIRESVAKLRGFAALEQDVFLRATSATDSARLGICAVGTIGIFVPDSLVWIAQRFVTSDPFYGLAAVRIAFGLILISVAPASRAPNGLRVLGYVIVALGITTALTGLLAVAYARAAIDWWLHQESWVLRLTSCLVLALGAFVAYACAPSRPTTNV
jgi:hypothetical protein